MFFKKKSKETVEFEATKSFMVNEFQYDANRGLIKIKNGFKEDIIPVADIQTYRLTYGNKTYTRKNLGTAIAAGAFLGVGGILLAGSHQDEYISNITIKIKANDKFYVKPLTIGKMKVSQANGILETAQNIIKLLDEITEGDEE